MKKQNFKNNKSAPKSIKQDDLKNKIYAWILLVAMVFWSIGSVLGIIAFASEKMEDNVVVMASAEEVSPANEESFSFRSVTFSGLSFTNGISFLSGFTIRPIFVDDIIDHFEFDTSLVNRQVSTCITGSAASYNVLVGINNKGTLIDVSLPLTIQCLSGMTLYDFKSLNKEEICVSSTSDTLLIKFYEGDSVNLEFLFDLSSLCNLGLNTYYYLATFDEYHRCNGSFFSYGLNYNSTYEMGYETGYEIGCLDGYNTGRQDGEIKGYQDGYQIGYDYAYTLFMGYIEDGALAYLESVSFREYYTKDVVEIKRKDIVIKDGVLDFNQFVPILLNVFPSGFSCSELSLNFNNDEESGLLPFERFKVYVEYTFDTCNSCLFDRDLVYYFNAYESLYNTSVNSYSSTLVYDSSRRLYLLDMSLVNTNGYVYELGTGLLDYSLFYVDSLSDTIGFSFCADLSEYNSGYTVGYEIGTKLGYSDGFNSGSAVGYDQGYKIGNMNGYDKGYAEGTEHANDYTFTGLISSVVDVPIQAFTSLFNFEILGVNLASFFYALLTVAIILTVVKLVM